MGRKKNILMKMLFFILLNFGLESNSCHLLTSPLSMVTETPATYNRSNVFYVTDSVCRASELLQDVMECLKDRSEEKQDQNCITAFLLHTCVRSGFLNPYFFF